MMLCYFVVLLVIITKLFGEVKGLSEAPQCQNLDLGLALDLVEALVHNLHNFSAP